MSVWTHAPIRAACWRVHLVGGVPRELFWPISLSAFGAGGISWLTLGWYVGVAIFAACLGVLELCRRATREDPMATSVWLRWAFEPTRVAAVGRFDQRTRARQGRR